MDKKDWPYRHLWDLGSLGPDAWLQQYGIDAVARAGIIDAQDPITETALLRARRALFVNQGWRLAPAGIKMFIECFKHYKATSDDNNIMTGRVLRTMDNAVRGPWGYRANSIITFDQQVHFELQMVGGSAQAFVEFKSA